MSKSWQGLSEVNDSISTGLKLFGSTKLRTYVIGILIKLLVIVMAFLILLIKQNTSNLVEQVLYFIADKLEVLFNLFYSKLIVAIPYSHIVQLLLVILLIMVIPVEEIKPIEVLVVLDEVFLESDGLLLSYSQLEADEFYGLGG